MDSAQQEFNIRDIIKDHYDTNYNRLVKRFSRWAGSPENAEDVVQTAYLRAMQYSSSFNESKDFSKWFNRILNNSLKDFKTMERGGRALFDEEELEGVPDFNFNRQLWREVKSEIVGFPNEDHKEVLNLYFIYGYTPRTIIRIVDLKYKTVETIINRFKRYVKDKYGDLDENSSRRLGG